MVMATGSVCQQLSGGELPHEVSEAEDQASASAEATALHERLVTYVHALAGGHEPRSGVWVEHSYARARGAPHAAAHVRVLLAPRPGAERADVDVEREDPPPRALPGDWAPARCDDSDSEPDDDWEARVAALAPSTVHAQLASQALDTLNRMRLERLAGGPRAARTAARRLRLALAAAAAHPAGHAQRPGAWLHAALLACMPAGARRLYDELAGELRRAAPRLAQRVLGAQTAPRPRSPLGAVGPALGGDSSPWLVWLSCGRARLDARWVRRLGALVHTRVVEGAAARGAPDAWCAAVAGSVRAGLADTLAEAGERPVILGGIGAGAALVTALAGSAGAGAGRPRGLLLLAPPLLTAEGARDGPDDVLAELRLPMLVVAGTGAAQCWRGAAREVTRGEAGARRVLELRGADDALRLPAALQRRRRLPQHALDAAVAEECARWAIDTAAHAPDDVRERRRREARPGPKGDRQLFAEDEDDYAHLPASSRAAPLVTLAVPSAGSERQSDAVGESPVRRVPASCPEAPSSGRVVSRGSGATPLALLPPRRRAPPSPPRRAPPSPPRRRAPSPPPAPALQAADIMRLPIVFADDEPVLEEAAARPVTVTSGSRGYTRVIVASRGPRGLRPGPGRGSVRPARPVLLRRGLRLLPRSDRPH